MIDGKESVNDYLQRVLNAEQSGIPVNWKHAAFEVTNVASNYIEMQANIIASLRENAKKGADNE